MNTRFVKRSVALMSSFVLSVLQDGNPFLITSFPISIIYLFVVST